MRKSQMVAPEQSAFDSVRLRSNLDGFASVLVILADSPPAIGRKEMNAQGSALHGIVHVNRAGGGSQRSQRLNSKGRPK